MKFESFLWPRPPRPPPFSGPPLEDGGERLFLPAPTKERRTREMSPREVAGFAYESYLAGALDWDEYRMLGFPAELHPAFDETIGALTGEKADPDRPRDVLAEWRERLRFARRHNADDAAQIRRIERIIGVLAEESAAARRSP